MRNTEHEPFHRSPRRTGRVLAVVAPLAAVLLLAACGSGGGSSPSAGGGSSAPAGGTAENTATPTAGGSFTMLEQLGITGSWPTGLDPSTTTTACTSCMDAIYGNLFELGPNGTTIPDLATGYTASADGMTWTLHIRQGVKFTDGSPFDAQVVAWNIQRDFSGTSSAVPNWPLKTVTTSGNYDVVIHLSRPYAPLINAFHASDVNWIASETSIQRMGEAAFRLKPVGAGPFTVVSDTISNSLVLKKNPDYWQAGHPYLDNLTFKTVASDEAALEALQSGTGDAYEGLQSPQLESQFAKNFDVLNAPSSSPYVIQLNTAAAPFNNIKAREAVYYATDAKLIDQKLFGNLHPVTEGFTAPGAEFYSPVVPGYRGYDLAKAKSLVKQAGGITVDLGATQSSVTTTILEVLQQEWRAAGMKVKIHVDLLPNVVAQFMSKKWQAFLQSAGAFDPAVGIGVEFRFGSVSQFSGVHDPMLDSILNDAAATQDAATRKTLYDKAAKYISDQAYAPFLFPVDGWNVAKKNVSGPGLTTPIPASSVRPEILWDSVGFTSS